MPVGLRGLLIAGNFRYRHGLAQHSDKRAGHEFHARLVRAVHQSTSTAEQSLRAVRWATVWFLDPDDYRRIDDVLPRHRASEGAIIPIVLGIFGYTYGSLLGVFLCGMFTKRAATTWEHHRDDHRLHRRRHFEWSTEQHRRPVRR
jgi:hypothetical protein